MTQFTKGETLKRLRAVAAEARRRTGLPKNVRVEVGHRTVPVNIERVPTHEECYPEGDDLTDFDRIDWAARDGQVRTHGAVVHLYLSTTGHNGQLEDVCVGWLGTPDQEARLMDTNGRPVA